MTTHISVGDDQVRGLLLLSCEVSLDDIVGAFGVSLLSVDGSSRDVGRHTVSGACP